MTPTQTIAQTTATSQTAQYQGISRKRLWTGRILTGLCSAFMIMDGVMKLFKPAFVVQANAQLGYPESTLVGIGVALLVSTVLYLVPRTSVLGVVLLTAYLGGAVATGVRVLAPAFNIVFPVAFACLLWAGLGMRDARIGQLLLFAEER